MTDWGDVLVIGAGPTGLCCAYYLEQAGIRYTVVDRSDKIGSTWANLYPSLHLNTANFVSNLPGQRIPLKYGVYPSGRNFYQYLQDYAKQHQFHIRLNVTVKRVSPLGTHWRVETSEGTHVFKNVMIATGRFGNPYIPTFEGQSRFQGKIIHSNQYREADTFKNQKILIIGNGPTGVDIALELTQTAILPVYLAVRSDLVIARSYPWGLPNSAWQYIAQTFLPQKWRKAFLDRVVYHSYRDAHEIGVRLAPNRVDRIGSSTPIRGRGLIDAIKKQVIYPVAGVRRFHENTVELQDGSHLPADTVILATGYRPVLSYLDIPYETDIDGWPLRISSEIEGGKTQVKDHAGLYLVGRFYRGLGPLYNIRHEAETAVNEIQQRLQEFST